MISQRRDSRAKRLCPFTRPISLTIYRWCVAAFICIGILSAAAITTPLPEDVAQRLAVRAGEARKASAVVRAYLLYAEAAKLDPLKAEYRQNRDELESLAKLLIAQKIDSTDIKPDITAATLEATPGSKECVAVHLAEKAEKARRTGEAVRAYLLYAEAAARDPKNTDYQENRNVLTPIAAGLKETDLEKTEVAGDLKAAELEALSNAPPPPTTLDEEARSSLASLPHVDVGPQRHDFALKGSPNTLIEKVVSTFGLRAIIDPGLPKQGDFSLDITDADLHTALEGLADVTGTFVFPVSPKVLFFAADTEAKRNEFEPNVVVTVTLPDALTDKDLVDAANGVRAVLNLRSFSWDSISRVAIIRDRFTRAELAKSLLQTLLVPHAQVSLELQFLTIDTDVTHEWGISPQTSFSLISPLQKLFNFNTVLPTLMTGAQYIAVGGGAGLFGIGVTSAEVFATYSNSITKNLYDATVVVEDGQTANLHVGEKYPIPTSLYTGAAQSTPSIYNPIGTFTQEDLGLVLKVTPHVKGDGEVGMDIEADYKALGTETFNTVPSVSERGFKGSVTLQPDEWAVVSGLDQTSLVRSRTGFPGLSEIVGLNQLLSQNNREKTTSETLVVLKPVITRLPMSDAVSPQFLLGPIHGERVLL